MQLKRGPRPSLKLTAGHSPPPSTAAPAAHMEDLMSLFSRRSLFASAFLVGMLPATALFAADKPKEIRIDWATYNPVSIVLKEQGLLEKEFAKDGITVRWVQTLGSNKALEFLNAGSI